MGDNMTDTALRMKDELLRLGNEDRAALAHFLIETLDVEEEEGAEEKWNAEITRRSDEIDAGIAVGAPAEQVFKALREKFS
jgi:putative addiction module component (TIGR02574 family)